MLKPVAKEASHMDLALARLKQLEQTEKSYNWLMDCARKTGVIVTFQGETMSVVHGTSTDAQDDLVDACNAIDAEFEQAGTVSAETIEKMRDALGRVGAA